MTEKLGVDEKEPAFGQKTPTTMHIVLISVLLCTRYRQRSQPNVLMELSMPEGRPWMTFSTMNDQPLTSFKALSVSCTLPSLSSGCGGGEMCPKPMSSDVTRHVANAAELPSPALVGSSDSTAICTPDTVLQSSNNKHTYTHTGKLYMFIWNK